MYVGLGFHNSGGEKSLKKLMERFFYTFGLYFKNAIRMQ